MATNFFAPGFDQQTEQQNIERSRQYAELMRQQGQQAPQGRMAGRMYVPPSITEGLAQMLRSHQGAQGVRQADERQTALANAVSSRRTQEMGKFGQLMTGTPENAPSDGMGPVMPAQAPDPRAAYAQAMGSADPAMQKFGMQGMGQLPQLEAAQAEREAMKVERAEGRTFRTQEAEATRAAREAEAATLRESRAVESAAMRESRAAESAAARQARADQLTQQHELRMTEMAAQNASRADMMKVQQEFQRDMRRTQQQGGASAVDLGGDSQAALTKQFGKAPAGFRWKTDGGMEFIPGGPADQKALLQKSGEGTVGSVVADLRDKYNKLQDGGGIVESGGSTLSNIGARVSSSGIGQTLGGAFGTKNQGSRDSIEMTRPLLLQAIMKATGMSAKQMDSNAELKLYLATATDPTKGLQANMDALERIENLYGGGAKPAAPAAQPAKSAPGMPSGFKVIR